MKILPDNRTKYALTKKQLKKENTKAIAGIIGIGSLLVPGGAFAGLGRKAIKSAFKKTGTIGNTKKPDTVGNRIRQTQAIMGKAPKPRHDTTFGKLSVKDKMHFDESPNNVNRGMGTYGGYKNVIMGRYAGTFSDRKYYRTLQKAVEQGPSKFFSSGRSAKTSITPNKRTLSKFSGHGALGGTSKGSQSFFKNKVLINTVELSNKEARKILKNKLRKNR